MSDSIIFSPLTLILGFLLICLDSSLAFLAEELADLDLIGKQFSSFSFIDLRLLLGKFMSRVGPKSIFYAELILFFTLVLLPEIRQCSILTTLQISGANPWNICLDILNSQTLSFSPLSFQRQKSRSTFNYLALLLTSLSSLISFKEKASSELIALPFSST